MGKIIKFHPDSINLNGVIPVWLSYLPATEGDETCTIYNQLCYFMMNYSQQLLGPDLERLSTVLVLFIEIFGTPLIEDETNPLIVGLLKQMQQQLPSDKMNNAYQQLTQVQQGLFFFLFFKQFITYILTIYFQQKNFNKSCNRRETRLYTIFM